MWRQTVTAIRAAEVGILWVTDQPDSAAAALRIALEPVGFSPADAIASRTGPADRKHLIRQRWAQTHCILAVVGDTRSDADEAYDYLRSPDLTLPIDANWGSGWFLLPPPIATEGTIK